MADWTQLPKELLDVIAKCLDSSIDTIRLRAVCSAWSTVDTVSPTSDHNLPFRYLPNNSFTIFDAFFFFKRTIFLLSRPSNPNHDPHSSVDSSLKKPDDSGSWLIKTEQQERSGVCRLFSPLSRAEIIPSSSGLHRTISLLDVRVRELGEEYVLQYIKHKQADIYMEKVAYLQEKNGNHLVLTVHVSGKLALYNSGYNMWTLIDDQASPLYDDVMVFDGKFYAVHNTGRTISIELVGLSDVVTTTVAKPVSGGDKKCLVSVGKDLILVDRYMTVPIEVGDDDQIEDFENNVMGDGIALFKVYKLDKRECKWVELDTLGDHVLFLGDNCAFSVSASDLYCSEGDRICFNFSENSSPRIMDEGNASRCHYNIGLFSMKDGMIERLNDVPAYSRLFWPPPHWIGSAS